MNLVRNLLVAILLGAFGGGFVATYIASNYTTWMASPAIGEALCNCEKVAKGVAGQILHAEWIGLLVGAVVGLILGIVIDVLLRRRRARAGTPPTTPSSLSGNGPVASA